MRSQNWGGEGTTAARKPSEYLERLCRLRTSIGNEEKSIPNLDHSKRCSEMEAITNGFVNFVRSIFLLHVLIYEKIYDLFRASLPAEPGDFLSFFFFFLWLTIINVVFSRANARHSKHTIPQVWGSGDTRHLLHISKQTHPCTNIERLMG